MLLRNTGIFTRILAFLHVDQSGPAAGWTRIWRSDLKANVLWGLLWGPALGPALGSALGSALGPALGSALGPALELLWGFALELLAVGDLPASCLHSIAGSLVWVHGLTLKHLVRFKAHTWLGLSNTTTQGFHRKAFLLGLCVGKLWRQTPPMYPTTPLLRICVSISSSLAYLCLRCLRSRLLK